MSNWRIAMATAIWLASPAVSSAGNTGNPETYWAQVAQVLRSDDTPKTQALSTQDRTVLRATLALKMEQPEKALDLLASASPQDPLVALLEAEAHRRQALRALNSARKYAHGVEEEQQRLASARLTPWLREAEVRLEQLRDDLAARLRQPVDILQLGEDVANVFMVDKARSRLFVFARDTRKSWHKVMDSYVVTGAGLGDKKREGDGRTPNGIYRFVARLQSPSLEPRYGPIAFPIDYPNALDRIHHKDGHGIWLHGYAPKVYRRPPRDTRGCFSLPNDLLTQLAPRIVLGRSWVVVGNNLRFDDATAQESLRRSVSTAIESWRHDWSSLDTEAYLRHYHPNFHSGRYRLRSWKRHKRLVNRNKRMIQVRLANVTMIHDPNRWPEGEVVVVQFTQHYRSDNYSDITRKRLYLARSDARHPWLILSEEMLPGNG